MGTFGNIISWHDDALIWRYRFGAVIDESVFEELLQQVFYGL